MSPRWNFFLAFVCVCGCVSWIAQGGAEALGAALSAVGALLFLAQGWED